MHSTNKLQYIKVLDSFLSSDSINTEEDSRWIIQKYKQYLEMNNRPIIDHLSDDDKLSTLTQKKQSLHDLARNSKPIIYQMTTQSTQSRFLESQFHS